MSRRKGGDTRPWGSPPFPTAVILALGALLLAPTGWAAQESAEAVNALQLRLIQQRLDLIEASLAETARRAQFRQQRGEPLAPQSLRDDLAAAHCQFEQLERDLEDLERRRPTPFLQGRLSDLRARIRRSRTEFMAPFDRIDGTLREAVRQIFERIRARRGAGPLRPEPASSPATVIDAL
ncbi:MAG: hypothetical protein GX442_05535 [Candidatus Riflebacteria bacterium]|nr:hypothetical protein [Candidatus Riflebacteria bacterium]